MCAVDGCEDRVRTRGWCHRHYTQWMRYGDPGTAGRKYGSGDSITYRSAHARVRRLRGAPGQFECTDCEETATEWSYRGGCPRQRVSPEGYPYSPDVNMYDPRCSTCHRKYDFTPETGPKITNALKRAYREGKRDGFCLGCNRSRTGRCKSHLAGV